MGPMSAGSALGTGVGMAAAPGTGTALPATVLVHAAASTSAPSTATARQQPRPACTHVADHAIGPAAAGLPEHRPNWLRKSCEHPLTRMSDAD